MTTGAIDNPTIGSGNHPGMSKLDELCIWTIRFLSMEGVQAAKSGHPGMPMGMAPAAYQLWMKHMRFNPANPKWHNRDRFVVSNGHGSMLLYSMLHLCGYDLPIKELKNFRQWESKTPGHPEYGMTDGVEVTTGPLGQGISNAVGMAIARKYLAAYFNRDGFPLFDYNIYVFAGDGCLMEGISSEACSAAGHLGLDNLIVVYDDNYISIDGETSLAFTEDRAKRYEAYGWHVQVVDGDGNDLEAFDKAIEAAKQETGRPSIIALRTHIGYGSPNFQDTHTAHGAPLGDEEIALIKKNQGWDPDTKFFVPEEVAGHMGQCVSRGNAWEADWNALMEAYQQRHPEPAQQLQTAMAGKLPINIDEHLPQFDLEKPLATRQASGATLNALMPHLPLVLGGSADLTPSNNTRFKDAVDFQKDSFNGRYLRYGVREHGMGAIMNGIAVSDLLIPYGATFFCFSDYMRPAIRLAALSHYPSIFVFTHDSIGLGEDGPTHQPVEHLAACRAIPNLNVFRPGDAYETAAVWKLALENRQGPSLMCLTRQGLPVLDQNKVAPASHVARGAYTLIAQDNPQVLLLATGSELPIAVEAYEQLKREGIAAAVVSMPCWELFSRQDRAYRDSVLPPSVKARVGVEAGIRQGWDQWLGDQGEFVGMQGFGYSAPYKTIYDKLGINVAGVVAAAKRSMS